MKIRLRDIFYFDEFGEWPVPPKHAKGNAPMSKTPREPRDDSGQSAGFGFLNEEELRRNTTQLIKPRKKATNPFLGEMVVVAAALVFLVWFLFL